MYRMFRMAGMALASLLAAGFIAACDSRTGTRASVRESGAREVPVPAEPKIEARAIRAGIGLDERSSQYKGLLKFKELV
ncbi:MAG: hypothetical protein LBD06_10515, partial [Candidatus Accumulibacter sp.]|nr:hypothetical protein [Accumulibacter sp.]